MRVLNSNADVFLSVSSAELGCAEKDHMYSEI